MSALVFLKHSGFGNVPLCDSGCLGTKDKSRSNGTWRVEINGFPAGTACPKCQPDLARAWVENGGDEPVVDAKRRRDRPKPPVEVEPDLEAVA